MGRTVARSQQTTLGEFAGDLVVSLDFDVCLRQLRVVSHATRGGPSSKAREQALA